MKVSRKTVFTIVSALLLCLSSCATAKALFSPRKSVWEEDIYVETEAEKNMKFPFAVFASYRHRLVQIEFLDSENLVLSYPKISKVETVAFKYKMKSTLYSWKRGYSDMQLCGIQLYVKNAQTNRQDYLELCRKGDFTKPISNPENYQEIRTRDKTFIVDFAGDNLTYKKIEDGDYDFSFNSIPNMTLAEKDYNDEIERENKKNYARAGGSTSIRKHQEHAY